MGEQLMDFQKVTASLQRNGFAVSSFTAAQDAANYLNRQIDEKTVAFGGSVTLQEMNLYESLSQHNQVLWHWRPAAGLTLAETLRAAVTADIYLTSVNGLAETGEMINIDGTGNRVAATCYGHKKVYFIVGANKIAPTYAEAFWRARNIAAPRNAQRLKRQTPCATSADRCHDCSVPDRICNGLTVLWRKMFSCEAEVVLVNENLGY
jgi:L-lactate utilization protein LutB